MRLVVETFRNFNEPSARPVRVRPISRQYAEHRVWCSVAMRTAWGVGQRFKVEVAWVQPKGRKPYLRILEQHGWEPVSL